MGSRDIKATSSGGHLSMEPHPDTTPGPTKRAPLALVLIVAVILGCWGLHDRGVLLWDEGSYLMEGRFVASGTRAVAWKVAGKLLPWVDEPTTEEVRELVGGIIPGVMGKPGHAFLVGVFCLVFDNAEYAAALLSVLCSLVIICIVYRIALRYTDPTGALLAAVYIAISPYVLFYRRVGLAEMDFCLGGLFLMYLLWRYIEGDREFDRRAAIVLGLASGAVFLLNYRAYILLALVLLWVAVLCARQRMTQLSTIARLAVVLAAFLVPLVIAEVFYQAGGIVAGSVAPEMTNRTYFMQLHWLATAHGGEPLTLTNAATYAYLFAVWEWPALALALIGTVVAVRRRSMADWLIISFLYLPMLQWSLRADGYARLAVVNLPMYALLVGLGFSSLWRARRNVTAARAVAVALALAFTGIAIYRDVPILTARSAHQRALAMTREAGATLNVDTNPGVAVVYEDLYAIDDTVRLPEVPSTALVTLREARDSGAAYLVTDMQRFIVGTQLMHMDRYRQSASHIIETTCEPVWQAPHMRGLFFHYCFEHNWGFARTLELYRAYRPSSEMIRIYSLDDAISALEAQGAEEGN